MCTHKPCEAQLQNQLDRWVRHSKVCTGKKELTQTAQAMMIQCTAGGEMHRKKTCDTFTTSYWLYKRKASFATAPYVKEVLSFHFISYWSSYLYSPYTFGNHYNLRQLLSSLHCVDKKQCAKLKLSRFTVPRYAPDLLSYISNCHYDTFFVT